MPEKKKPNVVTVAEAIRNVIDGDDVPQMKRRLIKAGGKAVEPILEAITGQHGPLHPARQKEAADDFFDVLIAIAKRDVTPLAEALAHDVPGLNAVVWAIGHSNSDHAKEILHDLRDHGDVAIEAVADHHLGRPNSAEREPREDAGETGAATQTKPEKRKAKKKARKKAQKKAGNEAEAAPTPK